MYSLSSSNGVASVILCCLRYYSVTLCRSSNICSIYRRIIFYFFASFLCELEYFISFISYMVFIFFYSFFSCHFFHCLFSFIFEFIFLLFHLILTDHVTLYFLAFISVESLLIFFHRSFEILCMLSHPFCLSLFFFFHVHPSFNM